MTLDNDPFGLAYADCLANGSAILTLERDDGYIDAIDIAVCFTQYDAMPPRQQRALRMAKGRVLDVGCGPGRHALWLQEQGLKVVGMDESPLALDIARQRGLRETSLSALEDVRNVQGPFDTVLFLGNNLGLVGSPEGLRRTLEDLDRITAQNAVILGESVDPCATDHPRHLEYHQRNRDAGRLPGQIRLRCSYNGRAGRWWDLLLIGQDDLRRLLEGTPWDLTGAYCDGPAYVAEITKRRRE